MKSFINYIYEQIEIDDNNRYGSKYITVTLVRRENLDLANLSEEDFIKFILEDYNKAIEEYTPICNKINDSRRKNFIENQIKAATNFAQRKWKTEKRRQEYIDNIRKNAEESTIYLEDPKRLFFDLKPDKGEMGIHQECIINKDSNENSLSRCYEIMQKSKYFKKGTGWAFKYESGNKETPVVAFRPYIDILLDESDRAEQKRDEENLTKAVNDFYKNTKYWGD